MAFDSWALVLLLIPIPFLLKKWFEKSSPASIRFPISMPKSLKGVAPERVLTVLQVLGLVFMILALARPQTSIRKIERSIEGIDILMVMDVSASMNAIDLAERSRLEVAKETMKSFILGRANDRIGFVAFSGEPVTLSPPTLDYGLILKELDSVEIGVLKDGTAIGDGLSLAVNRLRNSKAKSRIIILLTDGDNNVGQIDPQTAGELAQGYAIKVYTIAIGKEGRVKIPIKQPGMFGGQVIRYQWQDNALNPELLKQIAALTGGKFYRVSDEDTLKKVFKEIDELERSKIKAQQKIQAQDQFQLPLKLAFAFLFIAQCLVAVGFRGVT